MSQESLLLTGLSVSHLGSQIFDHITKKSLGPKVEYVHTVYHCVLTYFPKMLSDDVSIRGQKEVKKEGPRITTNPEPERVRSLPEPKEEEWPLFHVGRSVGRAICPISDGCIHRGRERRRAGKKSAVGCAGAYLRLCAASPMNLSFVFAPFPSLPSS